MPDGKGTTVWPQTSNYGWWWRGNEGADDNNNKTTVNKCAAVEAEDEDGWEEAGHGGGGGWAAVVRWWRRNSFAIRSWRMNVKDGWGCFHFLFLGGVKSYLESFLDKTCPKPRDFSFFWVGGLGWIWGRIRIGAILWSFLVIQPWILLGILLQTIPQNLLRLLALFARGCLGPGYRPQKWESQKMGFFSLYYVSC